VQLIPTTVLLDDHALAHLRVRNVRDRLVQGRIEALTGGGNPHEPVTGEHLEDALENELDSCGDRLASGGRPCRRDRPLEVVHNRKQVSHEMLGPIPEGLLTVPSRPPLEILEIRPLANPPILVLRGLVSGDPQRGLRIRRVLGAGVWTPVGGAGLVDGPIVGGPLILSIRHGFGARKNRVHACQVLRPFPPMPAAT